MIFCVRSSEGMLMVALAVPEVTTRGVSSKLTLTRTLRDGEPSWWLTWIWTSYSFSLTVIQLKDAQTQDTEETSSFSRQIVNTQDGPYCKVEGQARFEVLWYIFEGYDIGRLHNFNASLLCFNQIAACTGEKPGSNSSKQLPITTNLNHFINLDSKIPSDILTFYTMSISKHFQLIFYTS